MTDVAVRLSFPASAEYLLLARLAVTGVARRLPFGEDEIADLTLAVTEACGNAVRHAYVGRQVGTVGLDLLPRASGLELFVEDWGSGIPLPLPVRELQPTEAGGMGLSIMRTVVDELEIDRGPGGRGTVVHMTKYARPRRRTPGIGAGCEPTRV